MKVFGPEPEGKRKHTPVIEAPAKVKKGEWFDVKVVVGKDIAHPNTKEHWIAHISLWAGDFLVAKADLEPEKAASEVIFKVKLEETTTLTAHAYCNLHGLWHSEEVTVEVEE
ncbi:Desulfoferrodoxin ferrous iron-binding region [Desulfurobacterium thermolithotrophum DSM 11699]|uniref:Desulfoferrodoxin ferrous iron-binding region n=1 Tax=Desulfurobacterium thermolithotrophum (strain DSM 11699 / BSA) TaxID=868864 RepID=F0S320_DESTD|nr:class II SORL domain-containing protein [Desulfurobacterium thermolithotrophum]ADY73242.1 Desulfoferrodoxin ferrous iron-binding region [Desulfurobacterium thermolithotrophum DSM 11699]